MSAERVRIGMIGLGEHALNGHAIYLAQDPRVELSAVYDTVSAKIERFRSMYGQCIAPFLNERELLRTDIDAVVIATPDRFHAASTLAALTAGKHVLVEKPIADASDQLGLLENAVSLAQDRNLVLTSCHSKRFDVPYVWLKSNLEQFRNAFGEVVSCHLDASYVSPHDTSLHKGLLIDRISHEIDYMNFLLGQSNFTATKLFDSDTRYDCIGQRNDGVTFHCSATRMLQEGPYSEFVNVRFAAGDVQVQCRDQTATIRDHQSGTVQHERCGKEDREVMYGLVNKNFVDAILGKTPNYLTLQDLITNTRAGIFLTEQGQYSTTSQK